jgi:hypothetical protein
MITWYFHITQSRRVHLQVLLRFLIGKVGPVVRTLDFLNDSLHLFTLLCPFSLAHFQLPTEELIVWFPVATTHTIPQRCELSIIVIDCVMLENLVLSPIEYVQ